MLRLAKQFSNIHDTITAVAMYAGSLGYSGNAFCIEADSSDLIENKLRNYFDNHNELTINEFAESAVNIVYDKYVENLLQQLLPTNKLQEI